MATERSSSFARFFSKSFVAFAAIASLVACATVEGQDFEDEDVDGDGESLTDDDEAVSSSSDELTSSAGPCAGTALDRAVKCAQRKGARILSYYRSPKDQERVRRENRCTNRCTGQAGCVRPTAGCTTSPHTRCRAVDLVADGAPVSRSELRKCGLGKTTQPHKNHYDLVN